MTGRLPVISPQKGIQAHFPPPLLHGNAPCGHQHPLRHPSHRVRPLDGHQRRQPIEINSNPSCSRTSSNVTRILPASDRVSQREIIRQGHWVHTSIKAEVKLRSETLLLLSLAATVQQIPMACAGTAALQWCG